jgi:hypothetical protein
MLLSVHILFYALALTIWPVPVSVAAQFHQRVKPSILQPQQQPVPELSPAPFCTRLFTSTATGLLNLSKDPFRDNMTAGIEAQLTPARLQEIRDFWFEHLNHEDSFVIPGQDAHKRWYMGGEALDRACA